jgi:hypothetical protein
MSHMLAYISAIHSVGRQVGTGKRPQLSHPACPAWSDSVSQSTGRVGSQRPQGRRSSTCWAVGRGTTGAHFPLTLETVAVDLGK